MAAKRDYYEVLGVSRNADAGTIKKAYRKLAKKYHPDTNPGDKQAEKSFKEVTEAYTILSDPEKKKLYDQFGHSAFDGSGAGQNPHGNPFENAGGGYQEYHFESGNMDDIFGEMFDHIFHGSQSGGFQNSGFESGGFGKNGFYRQGFDSSQFVRKGQDLRAEVSITFEEAAFGCDKVIHLQSPDGRGSTQSLQVHIPAGIETGKSVRLRGKGMPGSNGGEAGDLLLKVKVGDKPGYERNGQDLYTKVNIPFTTAVFGGEVLVTTLYGNVMCKIRPGTQSGTKIRLRGKGIVSMKNTSAYGDQYVTVQIEVPKYLNPEAKQKLKEFEAACGQTDRYRNGSVA